MRTQQEILDRIASEKSDDFMGTQRSDLVDHLEFENAKPFLKPEYIQKVIDGTEKWEEDKTPAETIIDYLPFAIGKAEDERGLSASRSICHMIAWLWLDGNPLAEQIENGEIEYEPYGMPILKKIKKQYTSKTKK